MRRIAALAFLFLAGLVPTPAAAQSACQAPLAANTVCGRLGTGSGSPQAIPLSVLGPSLITNNLIVTSPLSISGLTLSITGTAGGVLAGASPAFTSTPTLGVASSLTGSLTFASSANSGTVTLTAPSTATSWNCKLPTTQGLSGQGLVTDGASPCQLSWAATSGTVNSGLAGNLAYYASNAAAVSGTTTFTINNSTGLLTLGIAGTTQGSLALSGATSGTTTLAAPAAGSGTMTLQAATDTLVGRATTDTLSNKTMVAPVLGAATATSINKVAITAPATSATLTIADGKTLQVNNGLTFAGTDGKGVTFNASTTFAGTDGKTLTISNSGTLAGGDGFTLAIAAGKTLTASNSLTLAGVDGKSLTVNNNLTLGGVDGKSLTVNNTLALAGTDSTTITFQGTDTYVGRTTTDTLTNKTLTAPTINGGTAQALTNLGIRSTGTGAFDLVLANSENLTAQRALTLTLNNAARTINVSGNLTLASDFTTAGANALTLTTTGTTNVTLPTTGTLAVQNAVNTFSATNTFSALQQFTDIKFSSGKLYPTADSTTAMQFCKADGTTCYGTLDTTNQAATFATLKFTTLDATSLASSTSTITGLTANNSPTAANDYVPYFSAADGRIRKITLAALVSGSVAGVANVNGLTGGLTLTSTGQANVASSGTTLTVAVPDTFSPQNCSLAAAVGSNTIAVSLKDASGADPSATSPCRIPFRNATASTGSWTIDSVTGALSISSFAAGASLGSSNNTAFRLWVVAFENSGTVVLALYNASTSTGCTGIEEDLVQSSTPISGAATAAATFYTPNGTTVSSKPIRILGYVEYNATGLATAGTYASGPNFIQTMGPGVAKPCQSIQRKYTTIGSSDTTSSTTFVASTNARASITPKSAANLISIRFMSQASSPSTDSVVLLGQLSRGTTNNSGLIGSFCQAGIVNTGSSNFGTCPLEALDLPNTTSSQTYAVQLRNSSAGTGTVSLGGSSGGLFIIEEIKG